MKKATGPYMQQAGRGNMEKTGRGIPPELTGPLQHVPGHSGPTDPPKGQVDVPTAGADGNPYTIRVNEGSKFHSLYKQIKVIPNSFRNIKGLTSKNDPWASTNTPERKAELIDSIHKAEMQRYQVKGKK
jgi:hypothetical protein